MNNSALVMLAVSLAGCSVSSRNSASGDENVTINAEEGGEVEFSLPFVKGQVQVPSGFMHNGNFDIDGVKLMPGSSVTGVSVFAANQGSTVNVAFAAPASPEAVRSYFVDQFRKQGIDAAISGGGVTGQSKDGAPFTIQVEPAASGSRGTIVIHSKD